MHTDSVHLPGIHPPAKNVLLSGYRTWPVNNTALPHHHTSGPYRSGGFLSLPSLPALFQMRHNGMPYGDFFPGPGYILYFPSHPLYDTLYLLLVFLMRLLYDYRGYNVFFLRPSPRLTALPCHIQIGGFCHFLLFHTAASPRHNRFLCINVSDSTLLRRFRAS